MNGAIRSQLAPMQGMSFWGAEQIRQQAERLWREKGLVLIDPAGIPNDFERQTVVNVANELYGER